MNDNDSIIVSLCKQIHDSPHLKTPEIITFSEKYPKLYDYVRNEEQYDENLLKLLLSSRNQMENDKTKDVVGVNDIMMNVAESIADKYLYNDTTLKRPSRKEMERCRNKVRNLVLKQQREQAQDN